MDERRMLHKAGGKYLIVETEDAKIAAQRDGWQLHKVVEDAPAVEAAPDPIVEVPEPAEPAKRKYVKKDRA